LSEGVEEIVVVPGEDFLSDFEAGLVGDSLDEVESGVLDGGHVGGAVFG